MRAVLSVILILASLCCNSQQIVAKPFNYYNKVYLGIENPVSYAVEGQSCKDILLHVRRGSIKEFSPCQFTFIGEKEGLDTIQVYKKGTNKKIGEFVLLVLQLPDPVAMVGGKDGGDFIKGAFVAQAGIGAGLFPSPGFEMSFLVVSYLAIVIRDSAVIFNKEFKGNAFNEELRSVFKTLKEGDKVIFGSIVVKFPNGELRSAKPLEYRIIE